MRSSNGYINTNKKHVDKISVLRLAPSNQRFKTAIHSLTIWSRRLSDDEIETRFTKGLWESIIF